MTKKVFFSFKYDDVQRAMVVRNSNVISDKAKLGFIDKADFEKVERQGDRAIQNWIDEQLKGTTVTIVLVGANTNRSRWVRYEIEQSILRGNGIITVDIGGIKNFNNLTTQSCSLRVPGYEHYNWNTNNGRDNLGRWVERAAIAAGK